MVERKACPCCGSEEARSLTRESYGSPILRDFLERQYEGRAEPDVLAGFDYEIVRCLKCGLGYQRHVPDDRLLEDIYERWIPTSEKSRLHGQYDLADYSYMADQVQFLIQHLGMRPHAIRVFDFGLGWAEWASMAQAYGCQVAGSELSPARIENARSLGIDILGWDEIPSRQFHFINTEQVFEHLIEPRDTLQQLARGLHPDGIIKIGVPDARLALRRLGKNGSFAALAEADRVPIAPLEHVNCYEFSSLMELAKQAGLRPLRPNLRLLYNSSSGWFSTHGLKLALRPIYRHWYPKSTFIYLTRTRA